MVRKLLLLIIILVVNMHAFTQTAYTDIGFKYFDFIPPTSKSEWTFRKIDIRNKIKKCFGKIPSIPTKINSKTNSIEDQGTYRLEKIEFYNGVDATVPGLLLIPKNGPTKKAAILYHHYHGSDYDHGKDEIFSSKLIQFSPAVDLVNEGYIVLAIDAYSFGDRSGKGPNGPQEKGQREELTWAKINMWKGRSYWGMMVRDDQMALSYLSNRPEVDPKRIAAIGLSMGCFRSFWLAAVDDRVKVTIPVSCITRNQELIKKGALGSHGIYYYVQDILSYFDNESIFACIAPRALLNLSGADDPLEPIEGQKYINNALEKVYATLGAKNNFKSIIYPGVGHEYTLTMWQETLTWLKEKL